MRLLIHPSTIQQLKLLQGYLVLSIFQNRDLAFVKKTQEKSKTK